MTTFIEETDKLLSELVLEVGRQVTEAYERKHGIWEGMSLENVRSKDKIRDRFLNLVSERVIGDGELHVSHVCPQDNISCAKFAARGQMRNAQRTTLYEGTKEEV